MEMRMGMARNVMKNKTNSRIRNKATIEIKYYSFLMKSMSS